MKVKFDGDPAKLKQVATKLKSNPNLLDELAADPKKFLKQFGLEVDNDTAKAIQAQAKKAPKAGAAAAQAGIVHIDV